jgi:hypothetical protein
MNTSTPDGTVDAVINTLLNQNAVADLERQVEYLKTKLNESKQWLAVRDRFLQRLYSDLHDAPMPLSADTAGMYERLQELVKHDAETNAVWLPLQEYTVELTYIVTVIGTVNAASPEDAEAMARDQYLEFALKDVSNELDDLRVVDYNLDEVRVA